jgi:hypothetical protein
MIVAYRYVGGGRTRDYRKMEFEIVERYTYVKIIFESRTRGTRTVCSGAGEARTLRREAEIEGRGEMINGSIHDEYQYRYSRGMNSPNRGSPTGLHLSC